MIVYRFEGPEGEGIYTTPRDNLDFSSYRDLFCSEATHPMPSLDSLVSWRDREDYQDFIFGFKDLDKAFAWFDRKQRFILSKLQAKLCAYKTCEVMQGKRQLVFKDGKKLCEVSLSEGYSKTYLTKQIKSRLKSG